MAEWLRALTSVLLILRSSHRCGFAPRTGHEFICETSHVLLAGVSGGFSPGTPVFGKWGFGGFTRTPPPPMGSNYFIFMEKFQKS